MKGTLFLPFFIIFPSANLPMKVGKGLLLLIFFLLLAPTHALTVVINSYDWRVVYLVSYYASLAGVRSVHIPEGNYASIYLPSLLPKNDTVIIYEDSSPVFRNYAAYLRANGFNNVKTRPVGDPYDLMFQLPHEFNVKTSGSLLVSDSDAMLVLAAGPLAARRNLKIYFINPRTRERIIGSITDVVYVVGYGGKSVKEAYPSAIFFDSPSKYAIEVNLAKELNKYSKYAQVYLMSGLVLYSTMAPDFPFWLGTLQVRTDGGYTYELGKFPVLVVPVHVYEIPEIIIRFLESPQIKHIVLYGPELSELNELRSKIPGKSFTSYLGVYYRSPTGATIGLAPMGIVLPAANVQMNVENVAATVDGNIYILFRNTGTTSGVVMVTGLTITCGDVNESRSVEIVAPVDARDTAMIEYSIGKPLPAANCTLTITYLYGPSVERLIESRTQRVEFTPQSIEDRAKVSVTDLAYSPRIERIIVFLKNDSEVPAYAFVVLKGLLVDGVPHDYRSNVVRIPAGGTAKAYVRVYLTDADILDNTEVKGFVRFGERRELPIHIQSFALPLRKVTLTEEVISFLSENWLLVAAVVIIILLLLFLRKR